VKVGARTLWLACALALPGAVAAQRGAPAEFTRQLILVAPFESPGGDSRLARRVAARTRVALGRRVDSRSTLVFRNDSSEVILERSGFEPGVPLDEKDLVILARRLRTDELIVGRLTPGANGRFTLSSELVLVRDPRRRQPLPVIRSADPSAAADTLVLHVLKARTQMTGLRRCENRAREGRAADGLREAEIALKGYPRSTLLRLCMAEVLAATSAMADSVRKLAEWVIEADSTNVIATVLRAMASETAGAPDQAAQSWARALALRGDSLELAVAGIEQLLRLERPLLAAEALERIIPLHQGDNWLRRQLFRSQYELARWGAAAALGDSLEEGDAEFRSDSAYAVRHVDVLRMVGDTLGAVAKSARSVRQHPGDARLYLQYVQLVGSESSLALLRGLARFPREPKLRVIAAQAARANGDRAAERAALALAVVEDPALASVLLRIAELWFLDGQADSALATLQRAPRTGSGASTLRNYAMGRGVQLLRAAADTMPETYRLPRAIIALADSVESREDTRSLLAAVLLQGARSELVVAARGNACDGVRRADAELREVERVLVIGIGGGEAAAELLEAQAGLRTAVDESLKRACVTTPPAR